ncbi:MAG: hypothetical protein V1754_14260 [Pseudomonadota bacterium]
MKHRTRQRKMAIRAMQDVRGKDWMVEQMFQVMAGGKRALDAAIHEMSRILAEAIMYMEREEVAGPDYYPVS